MMHPLLKGAYAHKSLAEQLLICLLVVGFGMSLGSISASAMIAVAGSGITTMKCSQALLTLFIFVAPALACGYLFALNPVSTDATKPSPLLYLLGICAILAAQPAVNLTAHWNATLHLPEALHHIEAWMQQHDARAEQLTEQMLAAPTCVQFLLNLVVMALLPAAAEELFFRGLIQRIIGKRYNMHIAIWLTAIIFSAVHLQFTGFVPRLLLGAMLGYMMQWSSRLYVPIAAHFVNNATIVCAAYLSPNTLLPALQHIGTHSQWWMAVVSAMATCALLLVMRRK